MCVGKSRFRDGGTYEELEVAKPRGPHVDFLDHG